MSIPLCLLWNLKISRSEKLSVGIVFVVGILTMIFAIIRTVSLDRSAADGEVSTTWLIFWAAIEGVVGKHPGQSTTSHHFDYRLYDTDSMTNCLQQLLSGASQPLPS